MIASRIRCCCSRVFKERKAIFPNLLSSEIIGVTNTAYPDHYYVSTNYFSTLELAYNYFASNSVTQYNSLNVFHENTITIPINILDIHYFEISNIPINYTDLELQGFINRTGLTELFFFETNVFRIYRQYTVGRSDGKYDIFYEVYQSDGNIKLFYA